MSKTVVGVFPDYVKAEQAARDLESQGFSRSDISVVANDHKGDYTNAAVGEGAATASGAGTGAAIGGAAGLALGLVALAIPGIGPIIALGPLAAALTGAGIGAAAGGLIGAMTSMGVPEEDAHHYSGLVKEGQALVMVHTPDNRVETATTLLERYGAEDVDERNDDVTDRAVNMDTATPARTGTATKFAEAGSAIPVVEEELTVGKREVNRGGVRVYSHVEEKPVSEQVELREEHVNVQRTPVNRAATESDFNAFREGTVEVREMAEEAVIGKRARVVEEVTVGKDTSTRTETVRDTVRNTKVDVEQLGKDAYTEHYRQNYATSGEPYETYAPGYSYGSGLANDSRYVGRDWNDVEHHARADWEQRGEGAWDSIKDSVKHGWDKVRGKA